MEKNWILVLCLLFAATWCAPPSVTKRYRADYEYNDRMDAFYKLHTELRRGWNVQSICQSEGASLMVPASQEDIIQVHAMFKKFPDLGQFVFVASDGRDHESAEETPIINLTEDEHEAPWGGRYGPAGCDVVTRSGEVDSMPCYRELPFVCKVEAKDAPYDAQCDLLASDYVYNGTVGSCYKIPRRIGTWNEAYAECRSEGAHLVVLNSQAEMEVVHKLMQDSPDIAGVRADWFFYAGFHASPPAANVTVQWRTIFNQTLSEAGFAEWSPGEPNNALNDEYCGSLFKNDGLLNDVFCDHLYAFICEKEVVIPK